MTPGPSCGIAQSMQARSIPALVVPTEPGPIDPSPGRLIVQAREEPEGAWVTYFSPESEDYTTAVSVHPDELSALRVAVEYGHKATFLRYGEML